MPPTALDLSALPAERRRPVEEKYWREYAAVRAAEVYPVMNQRFVRDVAFREAARVIRAEHERLAFVSARFIRAVVYEGR